MLARGGVRLISTGITFAVTSPKPDAVKTPVSWDTLTGVNCCKTAGGKNRNGKLTHLDILLISVSSKLFTVLSNYPLITAKTLYQANTKLNPSQMWGLLKNLYNNEGIIGFYKGIGTKVVGSLLNNYILMMIYEKIQFYVTVLLYRCLLSKQLLS